MTEPHPTLGAFNGRRLYGIRSLAVHAPRMTTVVEDCAEAARSQDARDKYFPSAVGGLSLESGRRARAEVPSLEAAKATLAAAASEAAAAVAALPSCLSA